MLTSRRMQRAAPRSLLLRHFQIESHYLKACFHLLCRWCFHFFVASKVPVRGKQEAAACWFLLNAENLVVLLTWISVRDSTVEHAECHVWKNLVKSDDVHETLHSGKPSSSLPAAASCLFLFLFFSKLKRWTHWLFWLWIMKMNSFIDEFVKNSQMNDWMRQKYLWILCIFLSKCGRQNKSR